MYLHSRPNWWNFKYDESAVLSELGSVRLKQGELIGKMGALGFDVRTEAYVNTLSLEILKSSEIEGEKINAQQLRSSIARRLGIDIAGSVPSERYVDGVVEMHLDATHNFDKPLTEDRLFGWHNVLFPTGRSGLYAIEVGKYRSREMQVVSGPMGRETVHYEAPKPEEVEFLMDVFLHWINSGIKIDAVLKAGIAHLWFVTIHPFDDGNGRIARAITDMMLSRSENSSLRFYSVSNEINANKKDYYRILEDTQESGDDITEWLLWFVRTLGKAIENSEVLLRTILQKSEFWKRISVFRLNDRQIKIINMLFDNFDGKLTSSKYAKICKCSQDTAYNDIKALIANNILVQSAERGRSANYLLNV